MFWFRIKYILIFSVSLVLISVAVELAIVCDSSYLRVVLLQLELFTLCLNESMATLLSLSWLGEALSQVESHNIWLLYVGILLGRCDVYVTTRKYVSAKTCTPAHHCGRQYH